MSYYGGWAGGDDYRAKGEIVVTSNAATSVSFKAVTYVESQYGYDGYGSTSADANAYGGTVRSVSGQSFSDWSTKKLVESAVRTVSRTHSSQTIQCSGYVSSYAGQSSWYGNVTVAALASYTVTYNANGGTGTTSAQTKWYGEALALRSNGFSRTGYTFAKWNTKADGSGTAYAAGASYTANAGVTLYAIWKANTYKVTPNANGGTLHTNCKALTKTYGTALALWLSSLNPTRTGYTFQNWNTKSNGSGTAYAAGAQYKTEAAATLYAIWKANTYAVTFNANGGSGAPAAQTQTHGVALTLSSTRPTRVGYTFLGWNTAADGSGTSYSAGGTVAANVNQALTLYAQWRADAPTLVVPEAYRSDALGAADDEGAYATVTARWTQADETLGGSVTITATVRSRGADPSPDDPTTSVTQTGTSGSASVTVGAGTLTQDDAYTITVTATNSLGTTTVVADVGTAWYPIDVKAGGHGIAIGGVASEDGFHINMPTRCHEGLPATDLTGTLPVAHGGTGATTAAGALTALGAASAADVDPIGTVVTTDISTAVSVADSTWTTVGSVALAAGVWVLVGHVNFGANATGRRAIALTTASDSVGSAAEQRQGFTSQPAASGTGTGVNGVRIVVLTSAATYNLNAYQNSGAALNVSGGCLRTVRIK